MEFDEKELRREIAFAIRNIHGKWHYNSRNYLLGCSFPFPVIFLVQTFAALNCVRRVSYSRISSWNRNVHLLKFRQLTIFWKVSIRNCPDEIWRDRASARDCLRHQKYSLQLTMQIIKLFFNVKRSQPETEAMWIGRNLRGKTREITLGELLWRVLAIRNHCSSVLCRGALA